MSSVEWNTRNTTVDHSMLLEYVGVRNCSAPFRMVSSDRRLSLENLSEIVYAQTGEMGILEDFMANNGILLVKIKLLRMEYIFLN